ncbi:hypothetical protein FQZ97_1133690 [compost metagenome]
MRADAATQPEYGLDQQWRRQQRAIEKMGGRVQVPDVVALDLEARLVLAAGLKDVGDILEGVPEDTVIALR